MQKIGTQGALTGFIRKSTEDLLKTFPQLGYLERKGFLVGTEIAGRLSGDYTGMAIANLERLRTIPAPYGPGIAEHPEQVEAIGGLIGDIREMATAMKGMGGLQQGDVVKELQMTNRLLKMVVELSRPDMALRMIGVNSGMVD